MAAVARLARRSSQDLDPIEAEAAARSARRAAEQAQEKEKQKLAASDEPKAPEIKWGNKGVHALLDDDYQIETSPPPPARRADANGDKAKPGDKQTLTPSSASRPPNSQAYPVPAAAPASASAWAPTGWSAATVSTKDIISAAAAAAPPSAAAPLAGGGSLDQAVMLLGEALRAERKRSEEAEERCRELESKLEEAHAAMVDEKQKIIDMLEARLKIS